MNSKIRAMLLVGASTGPALAVMAHTHTTLDPAPARICREVELGVECRSVHDAVPGAVVDAIVVLHRELVRETVSCDGSAVMTSREESGQLLSVTWSQGVCTGRSHSRTTKAVLFIAQQLSDSTSSTNPAPVVQTRYSA